MRTRKSNKTKSFKFTDYGLGGASDEENIEAHGKSDDGNFEVPVVEANEREDDEEEELYADPEESSRAQSEAENDGEYAEPTSKGLRSLEELAALELYPTDQRQIRHYHGPIKGYQRKHVLDYLYGPDRSSIFIASHLLSRWRPYEVLPSKLVEGDVCPIPSPWLPANFEASQERKALDLYRQYRLATSDQTGPQKWRNARSDEVDTYSLKPDGDLITLLGPHPHQQERIFAHNDRIVLADSGLPLADTEKDSGSPAGWMFDVGGLILAMGWLPKTRYGAQFLALAVVPHSDQASIGNGGAKPSKDHEKAGIVQLWHLEGERAEDGFVRPSKQQAKLAQSLCFDWGRVKRLQWCPIPVVADGMIGLLAILCADGRVHIVEVMQDEPGETGSFKKALKPMASLGLANESNIEATCFAWVNINRIVVGHSDGSVTLWSLFPTVCLVRQAIHTTYIIHIASGYPSQPYLVASTPAGGYSTLTDFSDPSCEVTDSMVGGINPQPNLLQWNDHLQGFFSVAHSSNPLNSSFGFLHSRYYSASSRRIMDGESLPACLAVGILHPFVLLGLLDGSVWALSATNKLLSRRYVAAYKMKVFQHEYRPREMFDSPSDVSDTPTVRGVSRILQGWEPVLNSYTRDDAAKAKAGLAPKKQIKPKRKKVVKAADEDLNSEEEAGQEEGDWHYSDPKRVIIYDPLTRITVMAWNPNESFGCWAAAAMGSGLVRVMDLGVEC